MNNLKQLLLAAPIAAAYSNDLQKDISPSELIATIKDLESAFNKEFNLKKRPDEHLNFSKTISTIKFFSLKPPQPPYNLIRFDDMSEAEDFKKRVFEYYQINVEIIPDNGRLLKIVEKK